jgi:tRNA-Thr(GGU) m(6)t(6)A37 methyltransferase TsaA
MEEIKFTPIGIIYSPFEKIEGMPIQPTGAEGIKGRIEIKPDYIGGLKDLEGFSHIILIYHFHRSRVYSLEVVPFMDDVPRGVFSTRAPKRPNAIGLSIVRLLMIDKGTLHIENVDVLNGTPLLDIKPYSPDLDHPAAERTGWMSGRTGGVTSARSDKRFD